MSTTITKFSWNCKGYQTRNEDARLLIKESSLHILMLEGPTFLKTNVRLYRVIYSTNAIDLALVTPAVARQCDLKVVTALYGCDHFPMLLIVFPKNTSHHTRFEVGF